MSRYIFLDRDGTIIKDKFHMYKSQDIEFLPGAVEGLRRLQNLGFEFIIITNQAGVRKGFYTLRDAKIFHSEFLKRLKTHYIEIKKSYFCFHKEEDGCWCRKPKPGLAQKASTEFNISLSESIFIGDKDCDIQLGKNCKGKTICVNNSQYEINVKPDYFILNLKDTYKLLQYA